jgi:hypothetical protein
MSKKILVIPDVHCMPGYDNKRLLWAGRFAAVEQVDKVICLGDFGELDSISHHNLEGSREGKRYQADIDAVHDGLNSFRLGLDGYEPALDMLLGNHEARISTMLDEHPNLKGKVSLADLGYSSYGWKVLPFKEIHVYAGVAFCHYFPSGNMGRAIGGQNAARQMLQQGSMSCVAGHSHLRTFYETSTWQGKKLFGITAGCYVHPDFIEGFNRQTARGWWYGLTLLDGVSNGTARDIRFVDMSVLKEKYA